MKEITVLSAGFRREHKFVPLLKIFVSLWYLLGNVLILPVPKEGHILKAGPHSFGG